MQHSYRSITFYSGVSLSYRYTVCTSGGNTHLRYLGQRYLMPQNFAGRLRLTAGMPMERPTFPGRRVERMGIRT